MPAGNQQLLERSASPFQPDGRDDRVDEQQHVTAIRQRFLINYRLVRHWFECHTDAGRNPEEPPVGRGHAEFEILLIRHRFTGHLRAGHSGQRSQLNRIDSTNNERTSLCLHERYHQHRFPLRPLLLLNILSWTPITIEAFNDDERSSMSIWASSPSHIESYSLSLQLDRETDYGRLNRNRHTSFASL